MGREAHILAVDLGTSAVKLAVVSVQGEVLDHEVRPLDVCHLADGGVVQSPDVWWRAVCEGTQALMARVPEHATQIRAVSCTGQWSGTVPVDAGGQALGDALIWMDVRGAPCVQEATGGRITAGGYGLGKLVRWLRLTGGLPGRSGKDPIAHILYLRQAHPELYRATHKFLEPVDYLNLRFSGRCAASYATITLHWVTDNRDLAHVRYAPTLLRSAGLDGDKLPELYPSAAVLGLIAPDVARRLGLSADVQIVMATPDVHATAIGAGAVGDGEAHLCLGTSSWLCAHLPHKKTDLAHGMASLPSAMPDRYLLVAEQESAGVCLTWLREQVLAAGDSSSWPAMETLLAEAAQVPPGSDGVVFAPWLNGERMPVDEHRTRASFLNLSLRTGRAHLVRAALEGVACNTRWLLGHVERFLGGALRSIPAVGGGAESDLWCQIFADVLGRPIRQVSAPRLASVRGAAFIGAVALGHLRFRDVPARVPVSRTFTPDPSTRAVYDALYADFERVAQWSFARAKRR